LINKQPSDEIGIARKEGILNKIKKGETFVEEKDNCGGRMGGARD